MIIIVNPPNPPGKVSNKDMMGGLGQLYDQGAAKIPPLDIPYIAACLKRADITFTVIDCLGFDYDRDALLREIDKNRTAGGLSVAIRTSLPTYGHDMEIARVIKQRTGAQIIMFGPQAALSAQETIEKEFIDVVVTGEPELILADMFSKGLPETKGVWFKDKDRVVVRNAPCTHEDLDILPLPFWESLPYKNYILPWPQFPDEKPFLPVATSRGCPFNCHYCPYPLTQGSQWRARSVEKVMEELTYIVEKLGITNILFRDPEFSLDKERIKQLCRQIIERGLHFSWRCETRIDTLDEDIIGAMARAGCRGMNVGVESLSAETLTGMGRKNITQAQARRIIGSCRGHNINTFCFFILGLPGEDKRDILKSIRFARKIDPAQVQFTFATPYPGTALARWAQEKGYIEDNDPAHYTGYLPVMRNEHLTAGRLKKLHRFATQWVSMRKSQKRRRIQKSGFLQRIKEPVKEALLWPQQWFL